MEFDVTKPDLKIIALPSRNSHDAFQVFGTQLMP
jgi:hypothetical protein